MSGLKVAICSTVRDCDSSLLHNIPFVEELCKKFKESHVVLVENDSKDHTKNVIHTWAKANKNVHVHSEDYAIQTIPNAEKGHPKSRYFSKHRIEAMSGFRNIYLEYVKTKLNIDYLIVIDLDVYSIEMDGIANSFGQDLDWHAMTSNGIKLTPANIFRPSFYDTYAFQELQDDTPQTLKKIKKYQKKYSSLKKGMPIIKIQSGFNGMALYQWNCIKNFSYECQKNEDEVVKYQCEHMDLHHKMIGSGFDSIYLNPSQIVRYENFNLFQFLKKAIRYLQKK